MKKLFLLFSICLLFFSNYTLAQTYHNLSNGAFSQNWANASLLTATDVWTNVPSIIGYRGDDITTTTGVDPQTLLTEGTVVVNVAVNQTTPNSNTSGGLAEFALADPVVAFQGSGTADAPNMVIYLNTTGVTNIKVNYNLRDVDGSADNSVQPVALQYRIGTTGNFVNIPSGFVADASSGPSLATLVTPVSVTLPAACENQGQVQLRIITANAAGNDEWIGIDDINISGTTSSTLSPPALTADATNNTVDNNIDISFTDDATWRAAVTAVKIGGTNLTASDYSLSSGNLQLKPSVGNALLTVSGSKTVTVSATGYTDATVTQDINAGVPTGNSTATINLPLSINSTRTITVTAKDQYNNLVNGYNFKYDVTVTNNNLTTSESYSIDGTGRTTSTTGISVVSPTNASGIATFTAIIPAVVDAADGVSIQVNLNNGTTPIGSAFGYVKATPNATLTSVDPASSDFTAGSINNIIYRIAVAVTNDITTLNSINVTTAGTFTSSDIADSGFKLWYSADNSFSSSSDTQLKAVSSTSGSGEVLSFTGLTQSFSIGTGYLFITADVLSEATAGHTISAKITSNNDLSFAGAITYGTGTFNEPNLHSVISGSLLFEENFDYTAGSDLAGQGGWQFIGSDGTNLNVSSSNLNYNTYPNNSGLAADLTASNADDLGNSFTAQSEGSKIYYSFLLKVTGSSGTGAYFTGFNTGATASNYTARTYVKINGTSFNIGIAKSTETATYGATNFDLNTTYLVVLKYEIVPGVTNDALSLFVFSSPSSVPATEPATPLVGPLAPTTTDNLLSAIFLRQASGIPNLTVDGIRISTSWGQAPLPVELSSFTASAKSGSVSLVWQTATEINNSGFYIERKSEASSWSKIGFIAGRGNSNVTINYSFTDKNAGSGKYSYRLKQVDHDGKFTYSKAVEVDLGMPKSFALDQNFPNPFNPSTVISYSLPEAANVNLTIYNALGQAVKVLDNGFKPAGNHQATFDAKGFSTGVYFYKLDAGNFSDIRKMILIK